MIESLKAAKRVAVPIVAIETLDQQNTARTIAQTFSNLPVIAWDLLNGARSLNNADSIVSQMGGEINTMNPAEMLAKASIIKDKIIICMFNAHRILEDATVDQGIGNLRNLYKSTGAMLVLLGPEFKIPSELQHDIVILTENLPDLTEIKGIITSVMEDAGITEIEDIDKIADTLIGLSAFEAEQTLAMCIKKNGDIYLDRRALWERKCKAIEQTPGLSIWKGGETFEDIGGCENIKSFLDKILNGKDKPRSIVFIDEIEKALAGSSGDTSGVSQDQLMSLLTFMQDKNVMGTIFIGPPGAAKSAVAKAAGNTANIPTISFDCGAMKNSLVGESGKRMRQALKVVDAVSQGKTLFIATCNSIGILPPELRRRFTLGTFFFDLPNSEERNKIWSIYKEKYALTDEQFDDVNDAGWTGAEIKQCCNIAYKLDGKLSEAASYIVPVSVSARDQIEILRNQASGCFISAGKPGIYKKDSQDTTKRSFEFN